MNDHYILYAIDYGEFCPEPMAEGTLQEIYEQVPAFAPENPETRGMRVTGEMEMYHGWRLTRLVNVGIYQFHPIEFHEYYATETYELND